MTQHPECLALWQRAQRVLGGGPATLSKHPSRYPQGIAPIVLEHGKGPYVWCADKHRYIDTVAALGPILLGHTHDGVTASVYVQAARLTSASLMTRLECEVAEMLIDCIPGAEMCRFASNGYDVTQAAVKLARYVTGRRHVIYVGYHGGFGDYLITTDKSGGVLPQLAPYNHQVRWGDWDALTAVLEKVYRPGTDDDDLAAIMLEVPPEPLHVTRAETTATIRRYADCAYRNRGVFILDNIVTGLRYGLGGALTYYGVEADLVTHSKALANGYPVAALTGPASLMKEFGGGRVFLSTTFGAQAVGLAAAKATLTVLRETDALAQLMEYGGGMLSLMQRCFADYDLPVTLRGNYARWACDFQDVPGVVSAAALRTLWWQELARRGVLASVPWFSMCCWTHETVQELIGAVNAACEVLGSVVRRGKAIGEVLLCPPIEDVFAQRYQAKPDWPA